MIDHKNQEFFILMQPIMEMKDIVEHMEEKSIRNREIEKIEKTEVPVKELIRAV